MACWPCACACAPTEPRGSAQCFPAGNWSARRHVNRRGGGRGVASRAPSRLAQSQAHVCDPTEPVPADGTRRAALSRNFFVFFSPHLILGQKCVVHVGDDVEQGVAHAQEALLETGHCCGFFCAQGGRRVCAGWARKRGPPRKENRRWCEIRLRNHTKHSLLWAVNAGALPPGDRPHARPSCSWQWLLDGAACSRAPPPPPSALCSAPRLAYPLSSAHSRRCACWVSLGWCVCTCVWRWDVAPSVRGRRAASEVGEKEGRRDDAPPTPTSHPQTSSPPLNRQKSRVLQKNEECEEDRPICSHFDADLFSLLSALCALRNAPHALPVPGRGGTGPSPARGRAPAPPPARRPTRRARPPPPPPPPTPPTGAKPSATSPCASPPATRCIKRMEAVVAAAALAPRRAAPTCATWAPGTRRSRCWTRGRRRPRRGWRSR